MIDNLEEEERFKFYVKMQLFFEEDLEPISNNQDDYDFYFDSISSDNNSINQDHKKSTTEVISDEEETDKAPVVFISYSWDNQDHREWVLMLAQKLIENGVDVILDKWELNRLGTLIPHFMEDSIKKSGRVICIMTPNYKKKTDNLHGGVGYEYSIISNYIFQDLQNTKFIPLFRDGKENDAIPAALGGRKYVDFRDDAEFECNFKILLRDIYQEPENKKPQLGKKPSFK
ncbi:MAG: toll/interleukin-1 receptor domain-containing protein [Hyphomicrobiales bacterium]